MRRRAYVMLSGVGVLLWPRVPDAQRQDARRRIGELWPGGRNTARREAFRRRLAELGHVEGRTLTIHERYAEGDLNRLPTQAQELVNLNVDVIVAVSLPAAEAARKATSTIPIVMVHGANSLAIPLYSSLAKPGGNVTGTVSTSGELGEKYLELLREVVPSAKRLAIVVNPSNAGAQEAAQTVMAAAGRFGIEPARFEVRRVEDLDDALAGLGRAKPDAALVYVEALVYNNRGRIIDFMAQARLPAMYSLSWVVPDGALMSYGTEFRSHYPRAAEYVDKILKGAKPGDLPIEQPTRFEMLINLRTARALGLAIPPSILARADEVIE